MFRLLPTIGIGALGEATAGGQVSMVSLSADAKTGGGGGGDRRPSPTSPGVVLPGSAGASAPVLLHKVEPEYTEQARAANYQGTVVLSVEIDANGTATNIKVLRSLGLGLDVKAIEAVRQWKFKPGYKGGQPVTVPASIEVNFRL